MAILRLLVFACALVAGARADYECLCAYAVETQIYDRPDFSANNIGYMYEFDCKPSYRGLVAPPGWQLVATEHQVGYVQNSTTVEIQVCQGSIPDEDKVTTTFAPSTQAPTTTTVTTQIPTTQTTTLRLTTPPQTVRIFTTTLKTTPTTPKPTTFTTTPRPRTASSTPKPTTTTRPTTTPTTPRPTTTTTTPTPTTTTTTPRPTTTTTTPKPTTTTTTTTPKPTTITTTPKPTTTTTTPRPTTTTTTPRPTTTTTTPKPTTTTTTPRPTTTTTTTTPRPTTTTTTTMRPTTTQYVPQCPAAVLGRNQDLSLIYKHRSYCYEFRNNLQDWEYAKNDCKKNGGFLLSIQSQDEQDFVLTMMSRLRKSQPIWLGLHDQVHEEQWQWVSGQPMKYKNWMDGSHHDKYHDFEDCALYVPARRGEWDDVHCTGLLFDRQASHPWICQYRVV